MPCSIIMPKSHVANMNCTKYLILICRKILHIKHSLAHLICALCFYIHYPSSFPTVSKLERAKMSFLQILWPALIMVQMSKALFIVQFLAGINVD